MADRKRRRAKCEIPSKKLSKEEDSIARFIRFNCPTNSTTFEGNEVHYFSARKAIDLLVESKKYGANAKSPKFPNSVAAEDFLSGLLDKRLFFRARKVVLKKKDKNVDKKDKEKEIVNKSPKSPKSKKKNIESVVHSAANDSNNENTELLAADEESSTELSKKTGEQQEEEKKRKKKVKLLIHDNQTFVLDPADVYVWIFDPTPFFKKVIGLLIVLGTIAGCLFPLWPDWLRLVIYYLSVTGIALFGLLLGIALLRTILFGIIWACTLGRHKLWVLPNLTEDCGFFESFKPFYTYEYVPGGVFGCSGSADAKKKKKKKSNADGIDVKKGGSDIQAEEEEPARKSGTEKQLLPSPINVTSKSEISEDNEATATKEEHRKFEKDSDQLSTSENSDDDDVDQDKNHPSDEVSDECVSEAESDRESDNEKQSKAETSKEVRRQNVGENGSPPVDDDFVIIDSSSTA